MVRIRHSWWLVVPVGGLACVLTVAAGVVLVHDRSGDSLALAGAAAIATVFAAAYARAGTT